MWSHATTGSSLPIEPVVAERVNDFGFLATLDEAAPGMLTQLLDNPPSSGPTVTLSSKAAKSPHSVRLRSPMFSPIVRRKGPLIARRAVYDCAPLQVLLDMAARWISCPAQARPARFG